MPPDPNLLQNGQGVGVGMAGDEKGGFHTIFIQCVQNVQGVGTGTSVEGEIDRFLRRGAVGRDRGLTVELGKELLIGESLGLVRAQQGRVVRRAGHGGLQTGKPLFQRSAPQAKNDGQNSGNEDQQCQNDQDQTLEKRHAEGLHCLSSHPRHVRMDRAPRSLTV